jgi:hypothetical protein
MESNSIIKPSPHVLEFEKMCQNWNPNDIEPTIPREPKTLKCQNKTDSRGSLKKKNQSTLVARTLHPTSMVRPEAISSIPTW